MEKFQITKLEKKTGPEKIIDLGISVLKREIEIENSRRAGGFMLTTLLGMGMALGMMGGQAEAQVRGIGPQGGRSGQVASEIFNRGIFEAGSAIDRAENAKRDKVEREYAAGLAQLADTERNLDQEYAKEKNTLTRNGDRQGLEKLEREYKMAKEKIAKDRINLKKEHDKKIRGIKIRSAIVGGVLQGTRGW